ncbi:Uma2 family endonuclease [Paractinoplanes toevensis]|uniref:Putative restriction endonuclease domain-containing protein n=1 Tax=Paractinoplanes toevensis TaxID=571911 RepID=A0A919TE25_9ACTN|nr:Uma2 family endonuclease [Actinoplanes toevensis]GIM93733.1 hypothetical protein Ato02nite_055260 [Actinoplanes toevensis]
MLTRAHWSGEAGYWAMGETNGRVELIDGALRVRPSPNTAHNGIALLLVTATAVAAREAGLRWASEPNLRLATDRIVIPDLTLGRQPWATKIVHPSETVLVVEVTSPSNAATDRGQKRLFYAEARIPWYLLVEPDFTDFEAVTLRLLRLDGDHYIEHAVAKHGETLTSDVPFPIDIRTNDLVDP